MCCHGCEAVARAIAAAGYTDFYKRRTSLPRTPEPIPQHAGGTEIYDDPEIQARYVEQQDDRNKSVWLIIEGITCSACAWLIEHRIRGTPGVVDVYVNYNTHRAVITWQPDKIRLSDILEAIRSIGYTPRLYDPAVHQNAADLENKSFLLRIGITGALGMQIMMIATAMYFGENSGMEDEYRTLFRWVSLFLTVPIVLYCALPFFRGALRDIGNATLGMDVPVAMGIGIAFSGSVWATWTHTGAVYYESVAMFVFLLLCARFLEARARHRSVASIEALSESLPDLAERRLVDGGWETVLASNLSPGDLVRIQPGAAFPADGFVVDGTTSVNESLLTGEPIPVTKYPGDEVLAGSINADQTVTAEVTRPHTQSMISQIVRLTEKAQTYKPRVAQLADRVASLFIAGVLLLAIFTGIFWLTRGAADWLAVVISVLIVTCPCALSLATPAALTSAVNALTRRSIIPVTGAALESLAGIDTVLLDKTGTLTEGKLRVDGLTILTQMPRSEILRIAAAVSQTSHHPVAKGIHAFCGQSTRSAEDSRHNVGGVSGIVDGTRYYLGNAAYIRTRTRQQPQYPGKNTCTWLATGEQVLARFELIDHVRQGAAAMLKSLAEYGIRVRLCSGDHSEAVRALAKQLGIRDWRGDMAPSQKLQVLQSLQDEGHRVAAVGDGTNDAPLLSAADISVAMAGGTDLARVHADIVLINSSLEAIACTLHYARRTKTIIRENLAWAAGYNLLALPAAATGAVPPWLAAIGMSLSSLIVVSNSLRLNFQRSPKSPSPQPFLATAAG